MNDWYVGQKVVCIEDRPSVFSECVIWRESFKIPLQKNHIYTIRQVCQDTNKNIVLRLEEIYCISSLTNLEYNWIDKRFRPLDEKEIDISVFHSILNKVNNTIKTPIMEEVE